MRARCDEIRKRANAAYTRNYEKRVEITRQRIIDEAGQWVRTLRPYNFGNDRFAIDATLRQAQREVRDAHRRRLDRIDNFERDALRTLTEEFRRENEMQGRARDAFTLATDRRAISDRRTQHERRRSTERGDNADRRNLQIVRGRDRE